MSVSHGAAWFLGVNDDGAGGGDAASASSRQPATQSIKPNHMPMPPPVSQCYLKDEVRVCQESILLAKVLKDSASPLLTKKTVSVVSSEGKRKRNECCPVLALAFFLSPFLSHAPPKFSTWRYFCDKTLGRASVKVIPPDAQHPVHGSKTSPVRFLCRACLRGIVMALPLT